MPSERDIEGKKERLKERGKRRGRLKGRGRGRKTPPSVLRVVCSFVCAVDKFQGGGRGGDKERESMDHSV